MDSAKRLHSSSAAGTRRIHAGSIGGQLRIELSNVPAALARAIFSGTAHRETYHAKRGESAGSFATAKVHRMMSSASSCSREVIE